MIAIRAHQLLCLQGFQGKGYSPDFVNNLQSIKDDLITHPQRPLQLTDSPSDVCASCPNLKDTHCAKDPTAEIRMKQRDQATLQKLGLNIPTIQPYQDWLHLVSKQFKTPDDVIDTCFDCQWQNVCLFHQSLQEQRNDPIH